MIVSSCKLSFDGVEKKGVFMLMMVSMHNKLDTYILEASHTMCPFTTTKHSGPSVPYSAAMGVRVPCIDLIIPPVHSMTPPSDQ